MSISTEIFLNLLYNYVNCLWRMITLNENLIKNFNFSQFGKNGIPLKYSRAKFLEDIKKCLLGLSEKEQNLILDYFEITFTEKGVDGIPLIRPVSNIFSGECKTSADMILNHIENFLIYNETTFADIEMKEMFDEFIKIIPEFISLCGKLQHKTHDYSVDIHTLKVLQACINDKRYDELCDEDKTVLKIAVLLHDTGKKEGIITRGHAIQSAECANNILSRFDFSADFKTRIITTVENHHWFENYNKGEFSAEETSQKFSSLGNYKIAAIIAKSDFSSINDTFHLDIIGCNTNEEFEKYLANKMQAIEDILSEKVPEKSF